MEANIYFLLARTAALLLSPYALFITAVALGTLLLFSRHWSKFGRRLLALAMLGYIAFGTFPTGQWALGLLEDRFPTVTELTQPVDGIIVLAGPFDTITTRTRGQVSLSSSVERMTEFIRVARANPQAKLIFAGGNGNVFDTKPTEAEVAHTFLIQMGFDVGRVHFEDQSRNTAESAEFAYAKFLPKDDERWLLITSARHMPRAMGLFRHAGWKVTAYPVDYLLSPGAPASFAPQWPGSLGHANNATYEWGGLLAAKLRGRIDAIFPGPSQ